MFSKGILCFVMPSVVIRSAAISCLISAVMSALILLSSAQSFGSENDILRPAVDAAKLPRKILFLIDTSATMRCSVGQAFDHHACNPPGVFNSSTGQYARGLLKNRKMEVVRRALIDFLDPVNTDGRVEVGIAVYSAPGAAILQPVQPLNHVTASSKTQRELLLRAVNDLVENGAKSTIGALLETAAYLQGSRIVSGGSKTLGGVASSWNPYGIEPFAAQSYSQAQSNMLSHAHSLVPSTARLVNDSSQCANARNNNAYLGLMDSSCINLEWDQTMAPTYAAPFRTDLVCPMGSPGEGVQDLVHVVLITDLLPWEDDLSLRVDNTTVAEHIDRISSISIRGFSSKGRTAAASNRCTNAIGGMPSAVPHATEICFGQTLNAIKNAGAQFRVWLVNDKPAVSNSDSTGLLYKKQVHPMVSADANEAKQYFLQILENANAYFPKQLTSEAALISAPLYGHHGEAFVYLVQPAMDGFWYGNLKKFALDSGGELVDSRGQSIWLPCNSGGLGCYNRSAVDFWSTQGVASSITASRGPSIMAGGAAEQQKPYNYRILWQQNAAGQLERLRGIPVPSDWNSLDAIQKSTALTLARTFQKNALMAGLDRSVALQKGVLPYLEWVQGKDASRFKLGQERDRLNVPPLSHVGSRQFWGASLQTRPVLVNYGFSPSSGYDDALIVAGNDGFVRALSAQTGEEYFSLMPRHLLNLVPDYYRLSGKRSISGLHGEIAVWRQDQVVNGEPNGTIRRSEGDFVRLYLSGGSSARVLWGVDVTDRNQPKMLFEIDSDTALSHSNETPYKNMGHLRAKPALIKAILPGENSPSPLLVFGGGLDSSYWEAASEYCDDLSVHCGNQIYWINPGELGGASNAGDLIAWLSDASNATLSVSNMRHSFASELIPVDINADGLTDFIYGVDVEGQVWRFAINHGQGANFIEPKVLAQLGQAGNPGSPIAEQRRFFQGLDAGVMRDTETGDSYVAVALGSGDVFRPFGVNHQNRLFVIKDREPFSGVAFNRPLKLSDSENVEINRGSRNASFQQNLRAASLLTFKLASVGEKMLVKPALIAGNVFFSTYTPPDITGMRLSENACTVPEGKERLYGFYLFSGSPVFNAAGVIDPTTAGASQSVGFLYRQNLPLGSSLQAIKARLIPGSSTATLQLGGHSISGLGIGERFKVYSWDQTVIRP